MERGRITDGLIVYLKARRTRRMMRPVVCDEQ